MRKIVVLFVLAAFFGKARAQSYVFAQLTGAPVNTTGWTLTGAATAGNITGTGNSEIILCNNTNYNSGAIFYNQPINLNICNKWIAEFDFRIFDGSGADGIAFCFLDVPPSGFVVGGGLGIPLTANGLKVCFDTYLNCSTTGSFMPKLELRWGAGYDECWIQPTVSNVTGALNAIRDNAYAHAKIVYNNGTIQVYLNNTLLVTTLQSFNFSGYPGFTASTGGSTDNHSIKNVVIYTDMPPSVAGTDQTICSGQTIQLGTATDPDLVYTWTPAAGLSSTSASNPSLTLTNTTSSPIVKTFIVNTAFNTSTGCTSADTVDITVLPAPTVSISTTTPTICSGTAASFTATSTNAGSTPQYAWYVNGIATGSSGTNFSSTSLQNGDIVTCQLNPGAPCAAVGSNAITINVTPLQTPGITISGNNTTCAGGSLTFTASPTNGGTAPVYQWKKNGNNVGSNSSSYTDNGLHNGDIISCVLTANGSCLSSTTATSNTITISIGANPVVSLDKNNSLCQGDTKTLDAGSFASYLWSTGATSQTITIGTAGTYYVTVTDANGCKGSDTSKLTNIIPLPQNFLPKDSSFCELKPFDIQPTGSYDEYSWNNGSDDPQITVTAPGKYWLQVTTAQGCEGVDSVNYVLLDCKAEIYFPTGFTPDGNGRNDLFRPISYGLLKSYKFTVFNRWGQVVFTSTNPQRGWDGTVSGKPQPTGVFVWFCSYQFDNNPAKEAKGTVLLIR